MNIDTGDAAQPTALITGSNSGVGAELTSRLLGEGWRVRALVRSSFREDAPPHIGDALRTGALRVYRTDLADPAVLTRTLAEVRAHEPRIDLLINNAGVSLDRAAPAPSGRDVHFEVNVLAPYLITTALLPLVAASAHRTILQVSSNALLTVKAFALDELEHPTRFTRLFGPYATSKLALSLWTTAFARTASPSLVIRSACPGPNDTPMTRGAGMPRWLRILVPFLFRHPRRGASTLHAAAFAPRSTAPGAFLHRGRPTALPFHERADEVLARIHTIASAL
jgi:NAD(P)-dependent dehydrogenase (short-subunit alcohol dehydrogenase family)